MVGRHMLVDYMVHGASFGNRMKLRAWNSAERRYTTYYSSSNRKLSPGLQKTSFLILKYLWAETSNYW